MIDDYRTLERRVLQDPDDIPALIDCLNKRARHEGLVAYAQAFRNRLVWNVLPDSFQDHVIEALAKHLSPALLFISTRRYTCGEALEGAASHRIPTFRHEKSGMELNILPGGTFNMGTLNVEGDLDFTTRRTADWERELVTRETPIHKVSIEPLITGRFPVLCKEWLAGGGSRPQEINAAEEPVTRISWIGTRNWLSAFRLGLRLPSEAEWEFACRAGTETRYFWGDEMDGDYCWHTDNTNVIHAAKDHEDHPNAFGLVDMSGNTWDWCEDDYIGDYCHGPYDHKPRVTGRSAKVYRGGGWTNCRGDSRSAARFPYECDSFNHSIGFRAFASLFECLEKVKKNGAKA